MLWGNDAFWTISNSHVKREPSRILRILYRQFALLAKATMKLPRCRDRVMDGIITGHPRTPLPRRGCPPEKLAVDPILGGADNKIC